MSVSQNKEAAIASFRVIESGDASLAGEIVSPDFVNLEARDDPGQPDRGLKGPNGFLATSRWLRTAFGELRFEDLDMIAEDEHVAVRTTMTGCHIGEFQGIAPTGRRFQQRQIHIFRIRDGRIIEHSAQRDDLGLLLHLGWRPSNME